MKSVSSWPRRPPAIHCETHVLPLLRLRRAHGAASDCAQLLGPSSEVLRAPTPKDQGLRAMKQPPEGSRDRG